MKQHELRELKEITAVSLMVPQSTFKEASSKIKLTQGNSLRKEEENIEALSASVQKQKEKKSHRSILVLVVLLRYELWRQGTASQKHKLVAAVDNDCRNVFQKKNLIFLLNGHFVVLSVWSDCTSSPEGRGRS